jgi:hypothetical protein
MVLDKAFSNAEDAYAFGKQHVKDYERDMFPGGMGVCLGVVKRDKNYQAVINTYYSFS